VAVIVVREVAVTVQRAVLLRLGHVMPASRFGKAKTVSQVIAVTLYLAPVGPRWIADGALMVAVALTVASGVEYAFRGRRLVRGA
jgi:CDP-diacylglycerol--glycerol-3-phosphate 3-phosphatidyltransferase